MAVFPSTTFITSVLNLIKNDTPYLALYTSNPGAGDTGTEVTGGSYARQAITFGSITSGSMSNNSTITFSGLPSATITHYGIRNASTAGDLLVYGTLNSPAVIVSGDQLQFSSSSITVNLSGS